MVSMFSIRAAGMVLTSITPELLDGVTRRPSTSTRVRAVPRPRSWMLAWPLLDGLFEVSLTLGTNCGSWLSIFSTVMAPVRSRSFWPTVTIGLVAT